jgi:hypothetical protein
MPTLQYSFALPIVRARAHVCKTIDSHKLPETFGNELWVILDGSSAVERNLCLSCWARQSSKNAFYEDM